MISETRWMIWRLERHVGVYSIISNILAASFAVYFGDLGAAAFSIVLAISSWLMLIFLGEQYRREVRQ